MNQAALWFPAAGTAKDQCGRGLGATGFFPSDPTTPKAGKPGSSPPATAAPRRQLREPECSLAEPPLPLNSEAQAENRREIPHYQRRRNRSRRIARVSESLRSFW